jgi:hypothetical protein
MMRGALCVLLAIPFLAHSAESPPGGYLPPQFDPQQGYTQFLIPRAGVERTVEARHLS